jgi:hypothetical protein
MSKVTPSSSINPMMEAEAFSIRPKGVKKMRKNPFSKEPQIGGRRVIAHAGTGVRKGVNPQL